MTSDAWGVRASALRRGGLVVIDSRGELIYDGRARAEVAQWVWSICHVLTHLGFGHNDPDHRDRRGTYDPEWSAACCVVVDRFLGALHVPGTPSLPSGLEGDEESLARRFTKTGIPPVLAAAGPAGAGPDMWEDLFEGRRPGSPPSAMEWGWTFALGLAAYERTSDPFARGLTRTTSIQPSGSRLPARRPIPLDP